MMTSPNGNIFRVTGPCAGNSPVTGEFPAQRPVTQSFDVFFDLRLNKRLSKQSWCKWMETLSRSSWRHCNAAIATPWNKLGCVSSIQASGFQTFMLLLFVASSLSMLIMVVLGHLGKLTNDDHYKDQKRTAFLRGGMTGKWVEIIAQSHFNSWRIIILVIRLWDRPVIPFHK